jgi:hypothetical protein
VLLVVILKRSNLYNTPALPHSITPPLQDSITPPLHNSITPSPTPPLHPSYSDTTSGFLGILTGANFGGRCPRRKAPATGTCVRGRFAATLRSRSPPRLISPRPTNSCGKCSFSPKIGNRWSTYLPEATLPSRTTEQRAEHAAASADASRINGLL